MWLLLSGFCKLVSVFDLFFPLQVLWIDLSIKAAITTTCSSNKRVFVIFNLKYICFLIIPEIGY